MPSYALETYYQQSLPHLVIGKQERILLGLQYSSSMDCPFPHPHRSLGLLKTETLKMVGSILYMGASFGGEDSEFH